MGYIAYMKKQGYSVEAVETKDMQGVKSENNIPGEMQSCHTMQIGNYFVEGHVPMAAVDKLLAEQPDIDGIAMPGMPPGSPGMPGLKTGDFVIYAVKDGEYSEFMSI